MKELPYTKDTKEYISEIKESKTISDLKVNYKKWCLQLHPDMGGNTEDMQELNIEYEKQFNLLKNWNMKQDINDREKFDWNEVPEMFIKIMEELIKIDGLEIEIVGSWIWLSGDTFNHKDKIKELGFSWSKSRKKWYKSPSKKHKRGSGKNWEEITNTYGCSSFKVAELTALN